MIALLLAVALQTQSHPAPPAHPAPPPVHVAAPHVAPPAVRVAPPPAVRAGPPARGFALPPADLQAHRVAPAPFAHPAVPIRRVPPVMPRYRARPPANAPRIPNPRHWKHDWEWNNGLAWNPAPIYWGGGFWGAYDLGLAPDGYIVEPDTPGADLLEAYDLTQTPCGPPDLVEIYGPDGSEICAYPNDLVAAGQYWVDPATLTLVSYQ